MPKYKIAIGLTIGDFSVHIIQPISLIQMLSGHDWRDYEFEPLFQNGIYIEHNRNIVAWNFLHQTDSDYLFFWDYDNGLLPDAFDLFMEDMEDPDVNIVSGLYYRKEPDMRSVAGLKLHDHDFYVADQFMFLSGGLIDLTTHGGSRAGMLGTGCMMLRRRVFEEIPYPWFKTAYKHSPGYETKDGRPLFGTEDTEFCELAQEHGFHTHLDTRIRSGHYSGARCWPPEWSQFQGVGDEEVSVEEAPITTWGHTEKEK